MVTFFEKQLLQTSFFSGVVMFFSGYRDRCESNYARIGNGDDELSASLLIFLLLLKDFVGEIPGKQQDIIRHTFQQSFRSQDGNVFARHEQALLVRIAIHNEVDKFSADATVVDHRTALGGGAIGRNACAFAFQAGQQATQVFANALDFGGEVAIVIDFVDLLVRFGFQQVFHSGGDVFLFLHINTERSPVDRKSLHVVQEHIVHTEQGV